MIVLMLPFPCVRVLSDLSARTVLRRACLWWSLVCVVSSCCGVEPGADVALPDVPEPESPVAREGDAEASAEERAEEARAVSGLSAPTPRPEAWRRGVALGLFVSTTDPDERRAYYAQFLDEIKALKATDVSLVVRWAQADVKATEIAPLPGVTVDDALVEEVAAMAAERGLRIFLLPILHLERRARGEWRGRLKPDDWDAWWASYERFVLHYAQLAERAGIAMLAVGSELATAERHVERWRALIRQVRARYGGALTYSANWDHFEPVQFWDDLDVVGVTAYQELSKRRDPGQRELVEGWRPFLHRLQLWARQHQRRYIFTEVGYPSNPTGAARPWDHRLRGTPELELQLRCYRALYEVWQRDPRLDGLYVWNWFGHGGAEDLGYTLRGKPARHVLHRWYSAPTTKAGPEPATPTSPRSSPDPSPH